MMYLFYESDQNYKKIYKRFDDGSVRVNLSDDDVTLLNQLPHALFHTLFILLFTLTYCSGKPKAKKRLSKRKWHVERPRAEWFLSASSQTKPAANTLPDANH